MNNNTNIAGLKKLAKANGLLAVIGAPLDFIIFIISVLVLSGALPVSFGVLGYLALIFRIAVLVMGIIASLKFKDDRVVSKAAHILLIVGGAVSLMLPPIGEICALIGGIIYLTSLKKFDQPQTPQMPNQNFQ